MLDIKFIRENKDLIVQGAKKKHKDFNVDELINTDDERKALIVSIEAKRAELNSAGKDGDKTKLRALKDEMKKEEEKLADVMQRWQTLMLQVPNIPDMSVPDGESDRDNVEIKVWGEKPKFDFAPKDHIALMEELDMVDFERGVKVHGFRGYFLKNDAVLLSFAIWNYALNFFTKKGFTPIIPPTVVHKSNMYGTGHLPADAEDYYMTQDNDTLAATAEIPIMGYHSEEVLSEKQLPLKYLGFSPCFRREAGSYSKDVKGLIRVNEFYKFEQVILCEASHETSVKLHEELNRNTEEFIESLGIPYRTVAACGGDLGRGHVKMYDIELWVPKEEKYREISSASYFHDFQCRRFGIRYRDASGKPRYAHSLNATAIPTPRVLVSLLENFQQADGSIVIPEVLRPYFGKSAIKKRD